MADTPTGDGAPVRRSRGEDLRLLRRYWPFVAAERRWLALGLLSVPVMTLGGLAQPYLIKEAIDGPIAAELRGDRYAGPWTIGTLALVFLLAVVGEYGFRGLQLYALQHAGYASLTRLRRAVFGHVLTQSSKFFDQRSTGTLLSRTTNDVEALGEVLTFGIVGILGDLVDIVAIFSAMVALDVHLTGMSLVVAPIIVVVVNFFRRQLRKYSTEIRRSMAEASGAFQEALAGARVVQLHGRRRATVQEYKALNYQYLRAYSLSNWYDASLYAVMDGVASLSIALVIWYGGGAALQGAVSVGLLVAFIQYIQRVFVPIRELSGKVATIERALAALERIFGLLDVDERLPQGDHAPAQVAGRIEFDGVQFSYDGKAPVLRDVQLQVAPGHMLALVGPTGSGKTTLARLLTRHYAASGGSVRLDGTPVEHWRQAALRRAVGVVQQDVVLFSGTLGDNVDLGRGLPRVQLETALRDACLGDVLDRMGGLDAVVGEGGGGLSAGERQLLSIARVLAANPAVVVLDEATASIDTLTEQKVQAAIERVLAGRTALVVAHRLSTVRRADQIAVLRQGEVVECGDHPTLVALGGLYAELVAAGERQGAIA
ncbi:MAG: ABC transporter ATP-binding protein [Deltaproteobacteria bacterium]|nr:ABC transporter ATP-binding protein [Deltaproteobacteria bacterium]